MASSRSQAWRGGVAPKFRTGIPCAAAMRSPIPVPPVIAASRVHAMTASTGRSSPEPSRIDTFRACSFRAAGEQRCQAGCRRAVSYMQSESTDRESVRPSGPPCPL